MTRFWRFLTTLWLLNRPCWRVMAGLSHRGFDAELDEARQLRDEGRGVIAGMQAEYATQTGISTLKIKHNNVLGYFIETTATHAEKNAFTAPVRDLYSSSNHRQCCALYHGTAERDGNQNS